VVIVAIITTLIDIIIIIVIVIATRINQVTAADSTNVFRFQAEAEFLSSPKMSYQLKNPQIICNEWGSELFPSKHSSWGSDKSLNLKMNRVVLD
jgi:hypothetical protein